jgi:chorismate mutase
VTADAEEVVMTVRAIRGATCLELDELGHMRDRVVELVQEMLDRNGLGVDDLISVIFTATPDLRSDFPAAAARSVGLGDVPMLCAQELDVPGALAKVVRVLAHAQLEVARSEVAHVYLRGAEVLRQDLAQ